MTNHTTFFCLKMRRTFGWFPRIFAGAGYRKLELGKKALLSASVKQKTVLRLYGIFTCFNPYSLKDITRKER